MTAAQTLVESGRAGEYLGQGLEFLTRVNGTGRVGRRGVDDGLGTGGDGGFELGRSDLVVGLNGGRHDHRRTLGQFDDLHVAHPVGSRHQHFVAFVHQHLHHVVDGVFRTCGHHDLVGLVVQVVVAFELVANGFFQFGITRHRRVKAVVVVDGLFGGLFDGIGGEKVRFAQREADHVHTLRFEFADFGRHGQGSRRLQALNAAGDLGSIRIHDTG